MFCDRLDVYCEGKVWSRVRVHRMIYKLVNDVLVGCRPAALLLDIRQGAVSVMLGVSPRSCGETLINTHRDSRTQ